MKVNSMECGKIEKKININEVNKYYIKYYFNYHTAQIVIG